MTKTWAGEQQQKKTPTKFHIRDASGPAETILFLATRAIRLNEEILYDYRVTKKSFQAEGADLDWLDD